MAKIPAQQEELPFFTVNPAQRVVKPPFDPREVARYAAQGVYLGTSSWKYRGWEGMIYQGGYSSEAQFQRQSLREYTSYFPCVGVDLTFYAWPTDAMVAYLLESTPENFKLCPKITKRTTMAEFPNHSTYGKWAGRDNPEFLNPELFVEHFWRPMEKLAPRIGSLIFEFSHLEAAHLNSWEKFFCQIPRIVPMAVEIRNPELLSVDLYRRMISLGLSPAFNSWSRMPLIREQMSLFREAGGDMTQMPLTARALLRPGRSYDEAVKLFHPYDRLQEEYTDGRDDLVRLMRYCLEFGKKVFILVNNRFEGSSPHTIGGLLQRIKVGPRK